MSCKTKIFIPISTISHKTAPLHVIRNRSFGILICFYFSSILGKVWQYTCLSNSVTLSILSLPWLKYYPGTYLCNFFLHTQHSHHECMSSCSLFSVFFFSHTCQDFFFIVVLFVDYTFLSLKHEYKGMISFQSLLALIFLSVIISVRLFHFCTGKHQTTIMTVDFFIL